jgi:ParB family transcriptional regulator, chromosome partitioning protein
MTLEIDEDSQKRRNTMNTTEVVKSSKEYMNVPIAELIESSTNPRKIFDQSFLEELAVSIRNKGILSPLLVRPVNNHLEIVTGAQRYRAAKLAGLEVAPIRLQNLSDLEAQEVQQIENVQRKDVHPFEEAQGYRTLLGFEGANYTIEKLAARIGKRPDDVAERLKLLDLTEPVANAFVTGHIGLGHALLIAKLAADVQKKALTHCFDGYYGANDAERSLVPASRLQAWIAQNIYLSLKSVPFSKDDESLLPEAGSCASCPKRTGFNTLLFSEVREDSCADAVCFNRKLDAHIAQRVLKIPNLVQISDNYNAADGTPILARRSYVEVVTRKSKKGKEARPEEKLCTHLTAAIHADGMDKGRLVKVCADRACKVHFGDRQQEEKQRLQWKAEKKAANRKAKQTLAFRHRLLADVLKRVKPQLGTEQLRMVTQFVLRSLSHELVCRLAKRHGLQNPKDAHDWQMAEKARALYEKADADGLTVLIFEAMLIGSAGSATENEDDDPLAEAAYLYKVDTRATRAAVVKAEKQKARTKPEPNYAKKKSTSTANAPRK